MNFIRDAEIENTLRTYATPLFEQAGVEPRAVHIHIVNTPDINAFVADGLNLFLMTGLIIKTKNAGELIGVIAHECGHIAGGHLIHGQTAYEGAMTESLAAMLLGVVAGAATGRGDLAGVIAGAGNDIAGRQYLAFSRMVEGSADTAALRFLDNLHESAQGFLDFMQTLMGQEMLLSVNQDPYVRTHPLTQDRIDEIRHHVELSPWSNAKVPPQFEEMHDRMVAKLVAFLSPPVETLARYKEGDSTVPARYARAIAYYRIPDLARAVPLIDGLIAQYPDDPYFLELKGQMLFDNSRVKESIPDYAKSVKLLPDNALLRAELGMAEVEAEDPATVPDAVENLRYATRDEPDNPEGWRLLSTAYTRAGQDAEAEYALAEYSFLAGHWDEAIFHAKAAEAGLKHGTPDALRAADIRVAAQVEKDKAKNR